MGNGESRRLRAALEAALPTLRRAVLSQPVPGAADSRVNIRPLLIRGRRVYQVERFRENKAFHQNVEGPALLELFTRELEGRYRQALIVTDTETDQYVLKRDGSYKRSARASVPLPGGLDAGHDREKETILREGENIPALVDLGVFTEDFRVVKAKYDKFRQINRFVELIDQELAGTGRGSITVLDFGCGKSYLTFILYYYFAVRRGMETKIIGYDLKADVVDRCNAVAEKYGYTGLRFVRADVEKDALYDEPVDMVVTLHACDTATDYALRYAVEKGAEYIFSVPCCQHEINSRIRKGGELDIFLRHGIVKERVSALLTDCIRAEILEDMGYRVDMIEFTDLEHTPKNIMLRARYTGRKGTAGRARARELAERYGFSQTLLELTEGK